MQHTPKSKLHVHMAHMWPHIAPVRLSSHWLSILRALRNLDVYLTPAKSSNAATHAYISRLRSCAQGMWPSSRVRRLCASHNVCVP